MEPLSARAGRALVVQILSSAWSMPTGSDRASPQIDADGFQRGQYPVLDSGLAPYEEGDDEPGGACWRRGAPRRRPPPKNVQAAAAGDAPGAAGEPSGLSRSAAARPRRTTTSSARRRCGACTCARSPATARASSTRSRSGTGACNRTHHPMDGRTLQAQSPPSARRRSTDASARGLARARTSRATRRCSRASCSGAARRAVERDADRVLRAAAPAQRAPGGGRSEIVARRQPAPPPDPRDRSTAARRSRRTTRRAARAARRPPARAARSRTAAHTARPRAPDGAPDGATNGVAPTSEPLLDGSLGVRLAEICARSVEALHILSADSRFPAAGSATSARTATTACAPRSGRRRSTSGRRAAARNHLADGTRSRTRARRIQSCNDAHLLGRAATQTEEHATPRRLWAAAVMRGITRTSPTRSQARRFACARFTDASGAVARSLAPPTRFLRADGARPTPTGPAARGAPAYVRGQSPTSGFQRRNASAAGRRARLCHARRARVLVEDVQGELQFAE